VTRDKNDRENFNTDVKSNTIDFSHEMLYRHAIVLKGMVKDIQIEAKTFTLMRPDNSHLVIWSQETEFLNVSPSTLNGAVVLVRGRTINGRLLAESIAPTE